MGIKEVRQAARDAGIIITHYTKAGAKKAASAVKRDIKASGVVSRKKKQAAKLAADYSKMTGATKQTTKANKAEAVGAAKKQVGKRKKLSAAAKRGTAYKAGAAGGVAATGVGVGVSKKKKSSSSKK